MYKYSFEDLDVWILASELAVDIYKTTENFPKSELFGLTSQLRRASISVSSNIAEGSGRSTQNDKAHFSVIAYGSLMEVQSQLLISEKLNLVSQEDSKKLRRSINRTSFLLNSYKNSQKPNYPNNLPKAKPAKQ